jgi:hypothetical protein
MPRFIVPPVLVAAVFFARLDLGNNTRGEAGEIPCNSSEITRKAIRVARNFHLRAMKPSHFNG